jgi:hypothetical protein
MIPDPGNSRPCNSSEFTWQTTRQLRFTSESVDLERAIDRALKENRSLPKAR